MSYTDYKASVDTFHKVLKKGFLKQIAFKYFENDRGMKVRSVLPDNSTEYDFNTGKFSGWIDPDRRTLENLEYNGVAVTANNIAANPSLFNSIGEDLNNAWESAFGENLFMANQPDHPGDPPMEPDEVNTVIENLEEEYELLCANPLLPDMIGAIKDKNYRLAINFLNGNDAELALDPTVGHELSNLFLNGDIHVVYQDSDIAILKPEYNHDISAEVAAQRRIIRRRGRDWIGTAQVNVRRGEVPEEAFVVGVDDTPAGLFAHSIDGTRLEVDQDVSREYLHDVMGFDTNYNHEEKLTPNVGERIRLQGDLAVEYHGMTEDIESGVGQCHLPIDNHYAALSEGELPETETKEQEPITVHVPQSSHLNISHDEHDNVAVELEKGVYEFYLLPRGLQVRSERPDWPEP